MDSKLLKAAQDGDVASLNKLLKEDPFILEKSALAPTAETPLHVAALAGKPDFVHEIILRKPSFAWELNHDGLSPLHIAVAIGYEDVVLELLKLGPILCLQENKQGLIPLHYAAMKGRVSILKELLKNCPESLKVRASQDQTVLHLAIKNCQFETFKTLVETLEDDDVEDFITAKDKDGNTVLQMGVSSKQLKVLEYLDKHAKVGMKSIEIISVDSKPDEDSNAMPQATYIQEELSVIESPQAEQPGQSTETNDASNMPPASENLTLVVASVIVTLAFQSTSPPEAIFKGNIDLAKNCTMDNSQFAEDCPEAVQNLFISVAYNFIGFFAACSALMHLQKASRVSNLVNIATCCMMLSYLHNLVAVYPGSTLFTILCYVTLAMPLSRLLSAYCTLVLKYEDPVRKKLDAMDKRVKMMMRQGYLKFRSMMMEVWLQLKTN